MKFVLSIFFLLWAAPALAQTSFQVDPFEVTALPGPSGADLRKISVSDETVIALTNDRHEYLKYAAGGWSRIEVDSPVMMINDIAPLPSGEMLALVSNKQGKPELWSIKPGGDQLTFFSSITAASALVTNSTGEILLLSNTPEISLDRGKTWLPTGTVRGFPIRATPMGRNFAVLTLDSVYELSPLEQRWTDLKYPVPFAQMRSVLYANDTLYVGTDLGLQARGPSGEWRDLSYDLEESEVLSITKLGKELIISTTSFTFASRDNGEHWEKLLGGTSGSRLVNFMDTVISWNRVGSRKRGTGGEWISNNGGLHYMTIDHLFTQQGYLIAGVNNVGVLRSTDGGMTWSTTSGIPNQANLNAVIATPEGSLLAGLSNHAIYRSTDNGVTWEESFAGLLSPVVYDLERSGDSVLAFTSVGVFVSENSGGLWKKVAIPDSLTYLRSYARVGDRTMWAGYEGLWSKRDGDLAWRRDISGYVGDIFRVGSNLVAGDQRVYVSTNGGEEWQLASGPTGQLRSLLHLAPTLTLAGTTYGLALSADSGMTWTQIDNSITKLVITSLSLDPSTNAVYIGTEHQGIFTFALQANIASRDEHQQPLLAYPNPASGRLRIELPNMSGAVNYRIIGSNGVLAALGTSEVISHTIELDLTSLATGQYLVEFTNGVHIELAKVIVLQ